MNVCIMGGMSEREIEWGDPPPWPTGREHPAQWFVDRLKEHPGRWAKYPDTVRNTGVTSQYAKRFPVSEWRSMKVGPNERALWGRWIGDE